MDLSSRVHSIFLGVSNNALKPEIRRAEKLLREQYCEVVKFWDPNQLVEDNYERMHKCDALVIILPKDFNKTGTIGKGLYGMLLFNNLEHVYAFYKNKIRSIEDVKKIDDPDSWENYAKLIL